MPDSALLIPLVSAGTAGIFCILFIAGYIFPRSVVTDLKAEIAELKADRDAQRARADVAVSAATATRDVMTALQLGQQIGRSHEALPGEHA